MQLNRLTERVWVYPFEEERDRPNLGYVRGDRWSLAVDAGHSAAHVREFYAALQAAGLPLPSLTVLTHWHWDHTFGMHAVHGLCLAGERTNRHLADFRSRPGAKQELLSAEERVRREYADGQSMIVTQADLTLNGEMRLETGGCSVRVFPAAAPHTDDSKGPGAVPPSGRHHRPHRGGHRAGRPLDTPQPSGTGEGSAVRRGAGGKRRLIRRLIRPAWYECVICR